MTKGKRKTRKLYKGGITNAESSVSVLKNNLKNIDPTPLKK